MEHIGWGNQTSPLKLLHKANERKILEFISSLPNFEPDTRFCLLLFSFYSFYFSLLRSCLYPLFLRLSPSSSFPFSKKKIVEPARRLIAAVYKNRGSYLSSVMSLKFISIHLREPHFCCRWRLYCSQQSYSQLMGECNWSCLNCPE